MTMTAPSATGAAPVPAQRRRAARRRPAPPALPAWSCENCTHVNAGRRRRCVDCGTTRD